MPIRAGRLAAILDALRVADITFDHVPTLPQTEVELMIYGDHWKRAGADADRRLGWPGSGAAPPARRARTQRSKRAAREPGLRYRRDP